MTQNGLGSDLWRESPPIGLAAGHTKPKVRIRPHPSSCIQRLWGGQRWGRFFSLWFRPSPACSVLSLLLRLQTSACSGGPLLSKAFRGLAVRSAEFLPCEVMGFMMQIPGLSIPSKDSTSANPGLPCLSPAGLQPSLYPLTSSLGPLEG